MHNDQAYGNNRLRRRLSPFASANVLLEARLAGWDLWRRRPLIATLRRTNFPVPVILIRFAVALWVFNFCFAMMFLPPEVKIVLFVTIVNNLATIVNQEEGKNGVRGQKCVEEKHQRRRAQCEATSRLTG